MCSGRWRKLKDSYLASLEVGKLDRVIPDEDATKHGSNRVVDESKELWLAAAPLLSR